MDFFFNDTATTEIYTLSLHDALPIWVCHSGATADADLAPVRALGNPIVDLVTPKPYVAMQSMLNAMEPKRLHRYWKRSEEHTSELQSRQYLVCRLLLEKKTSSPPPLC